SVWLNSIDRSVVCGDYLLEVPAVANLFLLNGPGGRTIGHSRVSVEKHVSVWLYRIDSTVVTGDYLLEVPAVANLFLLNGPSVRSCEERRVWGERHGRVSR